MTAQSAYGFLSQSQMKGFAAMVAALLFGSQHAHSCGLVDCTPVRHPVLVVSQLHAMPFVLHGTLSAMVGSQITVAAGGVVRNGGELASMVNAHVVHA